jgi:hypothetical protein
MSIETDASRLAFELKDLLNQEEKARRKLDLFWEKAEEEAASEDWCTAEIIASDYPENVQLEALTRKLARVRARIANHPLSTPACILPQAPMVAAAATATRKRQSPIRTLNEQVTGIRLLVKKLKAEGLSHRQMCDRLANSARPPQSRWKDLSWPMAYKKQTKSVKRWLSEATR